MDGSSLHSLAVLIKIMLSHLVSCEFLIPRMGPLGFEVALLQSEEEKEEQLATSRQSGVEGRGKAK